MKAGSASPSVSSGSNNDRVVTLLEEIKAILCKIAFPKVPTINVDADPVSEEEAPF